MCIIQLHTVIVLFLIVELSASNHAAQLYDSRPYNKVGNLTKDFLIIYRFLALWF